MIFYYAVYVLKNKHEGKTERSSKKISKVELKLQKIEYLNKKIHLQKIFQSLLFIIHYLLTL